MLRSAFLYLFLFVFTSISLLAQPAPITWPTAKDLKAATITMYWYESKPFIYYGENGKVQGIELNIMEGFGKYLKDHYEIDLKVNWVESKSFTDTYQRIATAKVEGTFGASAFSITEDRKSQLSFSPPYMADITVLVSSKNVPVAKSQGEFLVKFSKLTAITIQGTTYEKDLFKLREDLGIQFKINYIPSFDNILHTIEKTDNAFGFIDLPVYMMMFNENPSINVQRQNLFPIKREGYSIIYPLGGSWGAPLDEYFRSDEFANSIKKIVPKYLDRDVYQFIENLSIQPDDPVNLLNKEKEIQYRDLIEKSNKLIAGTRVQNILIVLTAISLTMLVIIVIMYKKRNDQKEKIEAQRQSIEKSSIQLQKRNEHLMVIDDEKNNLIKILAHDLRTPINHVQGLAQVLQLEASALSADQKDIIQKITDASLRLNKMITNILDIDSLENNRIKIFIESVKISPLLSQVVKSFEKQAAKKNIALSYQSNDEVIEIKGDPLFLTQVFENLVSNALKFSPSGKSVEVILERIESRVRIVVQDHGPGLTAEDLQLVFRKFAKLSAKPTASEGSTGLGLSIVKKFVELMQGRVWCESQPNESTKFIVEFEGH
jgi:signal transduction histidine kinase